MKGNSTQSKLRNLLISTCILCGMLGSANAQAFFNKFSIPSPIISFFDWTQPSPPSSVETTYSLTDTGILAIWRNRGHIYKIQYRLDDENSWNLYKEIGYKSKTLHSTFYHDIARDEVEAKGWDWKSLQLRVIACRKKNWFNQELICSDVNNRDYTFPALVHFFNTDTQEIENETGQINFGLKITSSFWIKYWFSLLDINFYYSSYPFSNGCKNPAIDEQYIGNSNSLTLVRDFSEYQIFAYKWIYNNLLADGNYYVYAKDEGSPDTCLYAPDSLKIGNLSEGNRIELFPRECKTESEPDKCSLTTDDRHNKGYIWSNRQLPKLNAGEGFAVIFDVTGAGNPKIALAEDKYDSNPMYEVSISHFIGVESTISQSGIIKASAYDSKSVMDTLEDTYWITFKDGVITLGTGGQPSAESSLLSFNDDNPNNEIKWLGLTSDDYMTFKNIIYDKF